MRVCPECGTPEVRVMQTALRSGGRRWRRLRCTDCGHRWSEHESCLVAVPPRRLRGRSAYETRRLTDWQAAQVVLSEESDRELARRYGITHASVQAIRQGRSYRNVWLHLQALLRPEERPYSPLQQGVGDAGADRGAVVSLGPGGGGGPG